MKKIKILLLALSVSLFSCEDAYKIEQDGEFGEDVTFTSVTDMQNYLSGVYSQASVEGEIGFTAIFTDEVGTGSSSGGQNLDLYKYFLTNQNGNASSIWLTHYALINYANRLLRGAERIIPDPTVIPDPTHLNTSVTPIRPYNELEIYNSIVAEARALRAFGHFQLLTYFSEDIKNDASLGVILMDRVPELDEQLPRNTTGEVFSLIESDLQYAEANLANRKVATDAYIYVSKNLINAMKARMYLYRGNYALAGQFADLVINTSGITLTPAGTYTTAGVFYNASTTTSPYRKMFTDLIQGEVIFGLKRLSGDGAIAGNFYFNSTRLSGSPYHDMGRSLFNLLNDPDGDGNPANNFDIRRRAYIDPTSNIANDPSILVNPNGTPFIYRSQDQLLIDKYPGRTETGTNLTNDLKVYRLSEMYFIKAEVLAAAGNINGESNSVASILKLIRDTRTYDAAGIRPLPVYASATAAWADILKERRVELCYEGHRYIDLRRLGTLANASIDRYYRDCEDNNVTVCTIPVTDYRFVLPIPVSESIGNANIQQNPGY